LEPVPFAQITEPVESNFTRQIAVFPTFSRSIPPNLAPDENCNSIDISGMIRGNRFPQICTGSSLGPCPLNVAVQIVFCEKKIVCAEALNNNVFPNARLSEKSPARYRYLFSEIQRLRPTECPAAERCLKP